MRLTTMLAVMTLLPALCFADGECPSRPATSQERSAYTSAYAAAAAAAAPAPVNWVRTDKTEPGGGETMPNCRAGNAQAPYRYRFTFLYEFDRAVRERVAQSASTNAMKGTPEQQVRKAELDAKYEKLSDERKDARKSHDRDRADRVKEELDAVRAERSKLNDEIMKAYVAQATSGELTQSMNAGVPARTEAEMTIAVNADRAWVPQGSEKLSIPGASHAYWRSTDQGSLALLLGAWDTTSPAFKATLRDAGVITTAQTIMVEIRAERQMAEKLAREMKLDLLKGQLK